MKLTTFTDYSLRTLIYLAVEPARRATIAQVAAAYGISENHLVKVVHFLGQGGWLANVRGKGGGLQLALEPGKVNLGELVRQTEGIDLPAECFSERTVTCAIARACRLRGVLGEAVAAFYAALDRYTLADLALDAEQLRPLLHLAALPARRRAADLRRSA